MELQKVTLISFSPTGTTRTILDSIAKGLGATEPSYQDLTLPKTSSPADMLGANEIVILGAPVYAGRIPAQAVQRFRTIRAQGTPAVLVVLYGNRAFEDALLELGNLAVELGFRPVAGAAYIGEHSFSTDNRPVAPGRPDAQDIKQAEQFGAAILARLKEIDLSSAPTLSNLPGNFPHREGAKSLMAAPISNESDCTLCGLCASICPTGAISVDTSVQTDVKRCIRCCACIKQCPTNARVWDNEKMTEITEWLYQHCSSRKEPEIFWL